MYRTAGRINPHVEAQRLLHADNKKTESATHTAYYARQEVNPTFLGLPPAVPPSQDIENLKSILTPPLASVATEAPPTKINVDINDSDVKESTVSEDTPKKKVKHVVDTSSSSQEEDDDDSSSSSSSASSSTTMNGNKSSVPSEPTYPKPKFTATYAPTIYREYIYPEVIKTHPECASYSYHDMITDYPHLVNLDKIIEIKTQKELEYTSELKKWEEANPEFAKKNKIGRFYSNAQDYKRRLFRNNLKKKRDGPPAALPTSAPVPTASVIPVASVSLPITVTPDNVSATAAATATEAASAPSTAMQQLIMAVKFMVKDEHHKTYLLYLLDTNEATQSIGIPIRIQGFLKAASYLCDASLYEYLKAISEKE